MKIFTSKNIFAIFNIQEEVKYVEHGIHGKCSQFVSMCE